MLEQNVLILSRKVPLLTTLFLMMSALLKLSSDYSGKVLRIVDIKEKGPGQLHVFAPNLSNGTYIYSLIIDGKVVETKKMVKME